jgi:hypothetical protein
MDAIIRDMRLPPVSHVGASLAGVVAMLALLSLGLQYALVAGRADAAGGILAATTRYFGYFTVLANVLVAGVALSAALRSEGIWSRASVRGLAALCIAVAMIIDDRVLPMSTPAQIWAEVGLHFLVPLAYLTWWLWWTPHGALRLSDALKWLLFPAAFMALTYTRGVLAGEWLYPVLDVPTLGTALAARNALAVFAGFFILGAAIFGVDHGLGAPRAPASR